MVNRRSLRWSDALTFTWLWLMPILKLFLFSVFGCAGVWLLCTPHWGLWAFSSCGAQALLCSQRASYGGVWPQQLQHMGSLTVAHWLSCPLGVWDLISLSRDQTRVPCTGRQILNQWTTREVPKVVSILNEKNFTYTWWLAAGENMCL